MSFPRKIGPEAVSLELSRKEMAMIELLAAGLKNGDIAQRIGTTEYVVKNYCRVIYDKTGMGNRVEVALWWQSRHPTKKPRSRIARSEWSENGRSSRNA